MTCWASMPTWMNYLASKLDDIGAGMNMSGSRLLWKSATTRAASRSLIYLTENLDCYDVYPDIHDHDDLGRYYIEELDAMQVPEHLRNYIDYEAYGRDIALRKAASSPTWAMYRIPGTASTRCTIDTGRASRGVPESPLHKRNKNF